MGPVLTHDVVFAVFVAQACRVAVLVDRGGLEGPRRAPVRCEVCLVHRSGVGDAAEEYDIRFYNIRTHIQIFFLDRFSRPQTASPIPPRTTTVATTRRTEIASDMNNTPPAAAIIGTESCATAA